MNTVLIFGAGKKAKGITRCIDKTKNIILYYTDNDPDKQGKRLFGRKVISPEHIVHLNFDYILIASIYWREIREQLLQLGVDARKIRCPLAQMKRKRFQEDYGEIYNLWGNQVLI